MKENKGIGSQNSFENDGWSYMLEVVEIEQKVGIGMNMLITDTDYFQEVSGHPHL